VSAIIPATLKLIFSPHLNLSHHAYSYWKLDASAYDYPAISVPWDPKDAVDPKLSQIRGEYME